MNRSHVQPQSCASWRCRHFPRGGPQGDARGAPSGERLGGEEEPAMIKRLFLCAITLAVVLVGVAGAQCPILDMVAGKVVQKYQMSTSEQLWEGRGKPKTQQEQEMIQMLRNDGQMRTTFIDKIAAPVANKMFECGMIPSRRGGTRCSAAHCCLRWASSW